jgi:hypothetical protein
MQTRLASRDYPDRHLVCVVSRDISTSSTTNNKKMPTETIDNSDGKYHFICLTEKESSGLPLLLTCEKSSEHKKETICIIN